MILYRKTGIFTRGFHNKGDEFIEREQRAIGYFSASDTAENYSHILKVINRLNLYFFDPSEPVDLENCNEAFQYLVGFETAEDHYRRKVKYESGEE